MIYLVLKPYCLPRTHTHEVAREEGASDDLWNSGKLREMTSDCIQKYKGKWLFRGQRARGTRRARFKKKKKEKGRRGGTTKLVVILA